MRPAEVDGLPLKWFGDAEGATPHVIVIHELWGPNPDIDSICQRWADEGFVAVAPDLYKRRSMLRCMWRTLWELNRGRGKAPAALRGLIDAIAERPDCSGVGVVGFCMGGGYALLLASQPAVQAAGVYYGVMSGNEHIAGSCPVVGGYGERDALVRDGRRMVDAFQAFGIEHDVAFYPGVGHSFMSGASGHVPGHPLLRALGQPFLALGYDRDAAEDSWSRMLPFFRSRLSAKTEQGEQEQPPA